MTARGRALLLIAAGALYSGLSLGGRMFYLSAIFAVLALVFSLFCVVFTRRTLVLSCQLTPEQTPRGELAHLHIQARQRLALPISPLEIVLCLGELRQTCALSFRRRAARLTLDIPARHIGELPAGIAEAYCTDALGLFRLRLPTDGALQTLLVLPRSFEVTPLRFLQGEEGRTLQNRTTEDLSSPEDTRSYRQGDALKRVHWKLSVRKRELVVRKFETPAPPDTLILLDCTAPADGAAPEAAAALRDALCETALSVAEMQARGGTPVRVPLYGVQAGEFLSDPTGGNTPQLAEMLARQPFTGGEAFSRVLNMELRRMRRTGATVIITAHLDAGIAEGIKHIRRMGPSARLYYITAAPDAPQDRPYIAQLQQNLVEVCYVTPA